VRAGHLNRERSLNFVLRRCGFDHRRRSFIASSEIPPQLERQSMLGVPHTTPPVLKAAETSLFATLVLGSVIGAALSSFTDFFARPEYRNVLFHYMRGEMKESTRNVEYQLGLDHDEALGFDAASGRFSIERIVKNFDAKIR
jgi:hypothetical protein